MKILTKQIEKNLRANAIIEAETGETQTIELKLFDPYGRFTFYASSLDADGNLFGFAVRRLALTVTNGATPTLRTDKPCEVWPPAH